MAVARLPVPATDVASRRWSMAEASCEIVEALDTRGKWPPMAAVVQFLRRCVVLRDVRSRTGAGAGAGAVARTGVRDVRPQPRTRGSLRRRPRRRRRCCRPCHPRAGRGRGNTDTRDVM